MKPYILDGGTENENIEIKIALQPEVLGLKVSGEATFRELDTDKVMIYEIRPFLMDL